MSGARDVDVGNDRLRFQWSRRIKFGSDTQCATARPNVKQIVKPIAGKDYSSQQAASAIAVPSVSREDKRWLKDDGRTLVGISLLDPKTKVSVQAKSKYEYNDGC